MNSPSVLLSNNFFLSISKSRNGFFKVTRVYPTRKGHNGIEYSGTIISIIINSWNSKPLFPLALLHH